MLPPLEETLMDPQKLLIHNRFSIRRLTPFDYLKWGLCSLAFGWSIGGVVAGGIIVIYILMTGTYPHQQWFMDNWIFIALYMTVFVGVTSLHEGATGYNRRINEDYSHKIWAGVYDDFFRKLREAHDDLKKAALLIRDLVDKMALYGRPSGDCFLCRASGN